VTCADGEHEGQVEEELEPSDPMLRGPYSDSRSGIGHYRSHRLFAVDLS
jgi:hypothetical protein